MNIQTGKFKIKNYMRSCYQEHIDNSCNVLNTTSLAEDAANHFNLYLDDINFEIDQDIYDYAVEVELELIKQSKVNQ
jgi:hypothetical protein